uniref:Uncharacterized protein n=1 Tax=Arundo donax TaxID=35708 RepID=A0A0A9ADG2_ARUDO
MFLSSGHRDMIDALEEEFGYSNDSGQGVLSELSKRNCCKVVSEYFFRCFI